MFKLLCVDIQKLDTRIKNVFNSIYTMLLDILNRTPGLLFTLMLIAFVIGTMVNSIMEAKKANDVKAVTKP